MKKFFNILDKSDGYIASSFLAVTIVLLSLQVFYRYVLASSITWSEELSRFTYVWCVYLGVSMGVRSNEHVRVIVHLKMLFPEFYKKILVLADFICLCYSLLLLYEGIKFVKSMFEFKFYSPSMGVSMAWIYMIIPLVFILIIVRLIQVNYLKFKRKDDSSADEISSAI